MTNGFKTARLSILIRVANRFKEKLDEALAKGYAGMRVNGSPAWLQKKDAKQFRKFEEQLDKLFPNERIIVSCTYPLATTTVMRSLRLPGDTGSPSPSGDNTIHPNALAPTVCKANSDKQVG